MWKVMTSSNNWLIICQLHQNLFIFICRQTTFFLNQISKGCVGSIICKWSEWIFGPRHHQLIGTGCYDKSSSVSNSVHWRRVFYNLEVNHISLPTHHTVLILILDLMLPFSIPIWASRVSGLSHISRYQIWIAFQTTSKCISYQGCNKGTACGF